MSASYKGGEITPEKLALAREMRERNAAWRTVVAKTGISLFVLKCELIPGFREKERQKIIALRTGKRLGLPRRERRLKVGDDDARQCWIVPQSVLIERAEILSKPLTLSQIFLGDPMPGRSALDKKVSAYSHNSN